MALVKRKGENNNLTSIILLLVDNRSFGKKMKASKEPFGSFEFWVCFESPKFLKGQVY
jgi:hypothetical protein